MFLLKVSICCSLVMISPRAFGQDPVKGNKPHAAESLGSQAGNLGESNTWKFSNCYDQTMGPYQNPVEAFEVNLDPKAADKNERAFDFSMSRVSTYKNPDGSTKTDATEFYPRLAFRNKTPNKKGTLRIWGPELSTIKIYGNETKIFYLEKTDEPSRRIIAVQIIEEEGTKFSIVDDRGNYADVVVNNGTPPKNEKTFSVTRFCKEPNGDGLGFAMDGWVHDVKEAVLTPLPPKGGLSGNSKTDKEYLTNLKAHQRVLSRQIEEIENETFKSNPLYHLREALFLN